MSGTASGAVWDVEFHGSQVEQGIQTAPSVLHADGCVVTVDAGGYPSKIHDATAVTLTMLQLCRLALNLTAMPLQVTCVQAVHSHRHKSLS